MTHSPSSFSLWLRWIGANALAELIGLGLTFGVGFLILTRLTDIPGAAGPLLTIFLMTASGTIEGATVAILQWVVLRRVFPTLTRAAWLRATLAGVLIAWFLGSLPAALSDLTAGDSQATAVEPAPGLVLIMAALMGFFLGLVLAFPQWRALKHVVPGAALWLPANMVAWAAGMPVIFAAVDRAFQARSTIGAVTSLLLALLLTGAVVGAIHGVALIRLVAGRPDTPAPSPA
ncbi:MAG: hypothetical protein HXY38_15255 [Chloroflexi bacterium]|nr:hypothetical protein [Chloroflexota bacterium]